MTGNDQVDYYVHRAEQARSLAAQAQSPKARAIHLDLARRYDQLLYYARSKKPLLTVVEGGAKPPPAAAGAPATRQDPRSPPG